MKSMALVFMPCLVCSGATITVDSGGGGDFTEIQPAIEAATEGDTVLVRRGEYVITEPVSFLGKAIAVRSEEGPEATTIRMSETPTDPLRASVVIFVSGEGEDSVLEGFSLIGGRGTDFLPGQIGEGGGGIFCYGGSSPTVTNCIIRGNSGGEHGGGLYCYQSSSPTLTNCTISGNAAAESGGGVYCRQQSSPVFLNCTIAANWAEYGGGGVGCYDASPSLTNCIV